MTLRPRFDPYRAAMVPSVIPLAKAAEPAEMPPVVYTLLGVPYTVVPDRRYGFLFKAARRKPAPGQMSFFDAPKAPKAPGTGGRKKMQEGATRMKNGQQQVLKNSRWRNVEPKGKATPKPGLSIIPDGTPSKVKPKTRKGKEWQSSSPAKAPAAVGGEAMGATSLRPKAKPPLPMPSVLGDEDIFEKDDDEYEKFKQSTIAAYGNMDDSVIKEMWADQSVKQKDSGEKQKNEIEQKEDADYHQKAIEIAADLSQKYGDLGYEFSPPTKKKFSGINVHSRRGLSGSSIYEFRIEIDPDMAQQWVNDGRFSLDDAIAKFEEEKGRKQAIEKRQAEQRQGHSQWLNDHVAKQVQASKGKKGKLTLKKRGGDEIVDATLFKHLAIHKTHGGYEISHIATGLSVDSRSFKTLNQAKQAVASLEHEVEWSDDPTNISPDERKKIQSILNSIRDVDYGAPSHIDLSNPPKIRDDAPATSSTLKPKGESKKSTSPQYKLGPSETTPYLVDVSGITSTVPRSAFDADQVESLAQSILESGGLLSPIVLKQTGPESFEVLAGDLEYHAAARAKELDPRKGEMVNAYVVPPQNQAAAVEQVNRAKPTVRPKKGDSTSPQYKLGPSETKHYLVDVSGITSTVPRSAFGADQVESLAQSILESGGLLSPIVLKQTGPESYEVLAGDLEYHAAARAKELDPRKGEMVNAYVVPPQHQAAAVAQVTPATPVAAEVVADDEPTTLRPKVRSRAERSQSFDRVKKTMQEAARGAIRAGAEVADFYEGTVAAVADGLGVGEDVGEVGGNRAKTEAMLAERDPLQAEPTTLRPKRTRAERKQDFDQIKQNLYDAGVSTVRAAQSVQQMGDTAAGAVADAYGLDLDDDAGLGGTNTPQLEPTLGDMLSEQKAIADQPSTFRPSRTNWAPSAPAKGKLKTLPNPMNYKTQQGLISALNRNSELPSTVGRAQWLKNAENALIENWGWTPEDAAVFVSRYAPTTTAYTPG